MHAASSAWSAPASLSPPLYADHLEPAVHLQDDSQSALHLGKTSVEELVMNYGGYYIHMSSYAGMPASYPEAEVRIRFPPRSPAWASEV